MFLLPQGHSHLGDKTMTHNQFLFAGGDRLARGFQAILAACLVAGITLPAVAITRTWDAGEGYGFNIWSMPANWDPDGVPGLMDIVFIGEYADDWNGVQLDIDGVQVYSLTLLDGADLYTNDHELIVNDKTVLTGGAGFELSRLMVWALAMPGSTWAAPGPRVSLPT